MSQRVKRPNRSDDGSVPAKRRKRTAAEEEETAALAAAAAQSSQGSWPSTRPNDLKTIYNRTTTEAPAELFRKDLISAMKLPDSEPLAHDEYWVIVDQWKQEWERGVQVPVNPDSLPEPIVSVTRCKSLKMQKDFRLPKNKYVRITKDENFSTEQHHFSNAPAQAEAACAYDLDEIDMEWLRVTNAERANSCLSPISEDQLERVIESFELCCWDKIQSILKNEEGLGIEYDETVICDVCRSPDSEDGNEMVFCDSCNICVHQACYGITRIPEGQWLCCTCNLGIKPECVLCPNKGGAMKCTRSGQKWAHVSCALWIPEVSIGCVEKMEPITKISSIPSSRWALICVLCRERVGACIQCSVKTCKTAYHVTCAFKHGLEMRAIIEDENADDGVKLRSYCEKHSKSCKKSEKSVCSGSEADDEKRKKRKDMTNEEKNQARAARLQEIESEFYKHVTIKDITMQHTIDNEALQYIYNYWKLKRKSLNNKPLLPPRTDDVDVLSHKREQADLEKMKSFVQLRQDLERVRNLCYMVSRREKLSRSFFRMREQTFHKQVAVLESSNTLPTTVVNAVVEANHGPSIYDRLYSHNDAEDHTNDFETILARIAGVKSPTNSGDERTVNGLFKDVKNNPYKKMYFNGASKRRSGSLYDSSMSSASGSEDNKPKDNKENRLQTSSEDDKVPEKKKVPTPRKSISSKKRQSSISAVVKGRLDSSSEDDIRPTRRNQSRLSQVMKEIGDSDTDSDGLSMSFAKNLKKSDNNQKKEIPSIYSDSEDSSTDGSGKDDKSSNATNDSGKMVRTKASMKDFTLKPSTSKSPSKTGAENKKKVKTDEEKINKVSSDLPTFVPQRQAAKKAAENMNKLTSRGKEQFVAQEESAAKVEEKPVKKPSENKKKEEESPSKVEKEEKEPTPPKKDEKKPLKPKLTRGAANRDTIKEKEPEKEKEAKKKPEPKTADVEASVEFLAAFVPQRQAAKKAAEGIKSGLGKTVNTTVPDSSPSEAAKKDLTESPKSKKKEDQPPEPKQKQQESSKKEPSETTSTVKQQPAKVAESKRKSSTHSTRTSSSSSSTSSGSSSDSSSSSSSDSEEEQQPQKSTQAPSQQQQQPPPSESQATAPASTAPAQKQQQRAESQQEPPANKRSSQGAEDWPFLDKAPKSGAQRTDTPRAPPAKRAAPSSSSASSSDSSGDSDASSSGASNDASPSRARKGPAAAVQQRRISSMGGAASAQSKEQQHSSDQSRVDAAAVVGLGASGTTTTATTTSQQQQRGRSSRKPSGDKKLPASPPKREEQPARRGRQARAARGRGSRRVSQASGDRIGDSNVRSRDSSDEQPQQRTHSESERPKNLRKSQGKPTANATAQEEPLHKTSESRKTADTQKPKEEAVHKSGEAKKANEPAAKLLAAREKTEKKLKENLPVRKEIDMEKEITERKVTTKDGNKSKATLDKLFSEKDNKNDKKKSPERLRAKSNQEKAKERQAKEKAREKLDKEKRNREKLEKEKQEKEKAREEEERLKEIQEKERLRELQEKEKIREIKEKERIIEMQEKEKAREIQEKEKAREMQEKARELQEKEKAREMQEKARELQEKEKAREMQEKARELQEKEKARELQEKEKAKEIQEKDRSPEKLVKKSESIIKQPNKELKEQVDKKTANKKSPSKSRSIDDIFAEKLHSDTKENKRSTLKPSKISEEISVADKIVDEHVQSQKQKESEQLFQKSLDDCLDGKSILGEQDVETRNATRHIEVLQNHQRSIFSPRSHKEDRDLLADFDFDDGFDLNKDDEVTKNQPLTSYGPVLNNSIREDTREDSARETLNLVEKLRMGLSKKSTSGETDECGSNEIESDREQVVPNNGVPEEPALEKDAAKPSLIGMEGEQGLGELPTQKTADFTSDHAFKPQDANEHGQKSHNNYPYSEQNLALDPMKQVPVTQPQPMVHGAPIQGDERWVPPSGTFNDQQPLFSGNTSFMTQQFQNTQHGNQMLDSITNLDQMPPITQVSSMPVAQTLTTKERSTTPTQISMPMMPPQTPLQPPQTPLHDTASMDCMQSPYPDIHPQRKWAEFEVMPKRRSSTSSSGSDSSRSSRKEEEENRRQQEVRVVNHSSLDISSGLPGQVPSLTSQVPPYPPLMDNYGASFPDQSSQFVPPVTLFAPPDMNAQIPFGSGSQVPGIPGSAGMFPSMPPQFGAPFTNSTLMPALSKPMEDAMAFPLPCTAAFTTSQQNMELTAAMVNMSEGAAPKVAEQDLQDQLSSNTDQSLTPTTMVQQPFADEVVPLPVLSGTTPTSTTTLPSPSTSLKSNNSSTGKKSPSKPTRISARVITQMMNKSPAGKSPGKSPRQQEAAQKAPGRGRGDHKKGGGRGAPGKTQAASRGKGRGRGRGRGGHHNDYGYIDTNTIHNKLVGTVYDLDFDDDISNDNMTDLKSMRERRKSIDVHDNKRYDYNSPKSPKFSSPTQYTHKGSRFNAEHLRDLRPPSPIEESKSKSVESDPPRVFPDVTPVLPGPVDMRTYNNSTSFDHPSYNEHHLLSAFASGTAETQLHEDIDEDFEKELHSALTAKKPEPPPPKEENSNSSSSNNIKVSLSDDRNQLKVKIKGPIANYTSTVAPLPPPAVEASITLSNVNTPTANAISSASIGMSSGGGTSSLRRMRKKELLKQYISGSQDTFDEAASGTGFSVVPALPTVNRTTITIPKAISSMTSIPTKEDYQDYRTNDDHYEIKQHKKSRPLARELRQLDLSLDDDFNRLERRGSVGSSTSNSFDSNANKRRGRPATKPTAPKLKIKFGNNSVTSEAEKPTEERTLRPPKKRIPSTPVTKPSLDDLKRQSMEYRKQIMADLKVDKHKHKERKEKHKKKKEKRKEREMRIISDAPTKLIIRFSSKSIKSEVRTSDVDTTRSRTNPEVPDDVEPPRLTPIKLKLSRLGVGSGYVMKPSSEPGSSKTDEDQATQPGQPPPLIIPIPSGTPSPPPLAEADPLAIPDPLALQPDPAPAPLNKDCEVR